jgi:hypothetical protein
MRLFMLKMSDATVLPEKLQGLEATFGPEEAYRFHVPSEDCDHPVLFAQREGYLQIPAFEAAERFNGRKNIVSIQISKTDYSGTSYFSLHSQAYLPEEKRPAGLFFRWRNGTKWLRYDSKTNMFSAHPKVVYETQLRCSGLGR